VDEEDVSRREQQLMMIVRTDGHDERIDGFWEHYRPYELTVLGDQYSFNMPNSVRSDDPDYYYYYYYFLVPSVAKIPRVKS